MKQSPEISVKLSEDPLRRLLYISDAEGRTPNNQFLLMLRNYISYFERTKGRISPAELSKINIDEYIKNEQE